MLIHCMINAWNQKKSEAHNYDCDINLDLFELISVPFTCCPPNAMTRKSTWILLFTVYTVLPSLTAAAGCSRNSVCDGRSISSCRDTPGCYLNSDNSCRGRPRCARDSSNNEHYRDGRRFRYAWPAEEGWVLAPSQIRMGNSTVLTRHSHINNIEDCMEKCASDNAVALNFVPDDEGVNLLSQCWCFFEAECSEPIASLKGVILSSVAKPQQCETSYCEEYAGDVEKTAFCFGLDSANTTRLRSELNAMTHSTESSSAVCTFSATSAITSIITAVGIMSFFADFMGDIH